MPASLNLVTVLEKLRKNSHLGKHKHFAAADRNKRYDYIFTISIILINFSIAIAHMGSIGKEMEKWITYSISIASVLAVLMAGFEFRFNFSKIFETHRRIGNKYLKLARECEQEIALYQDGRINDQQFQHVTEELNKRYNDINEDAESFPTNQSDYKKALAIETAKRQTINIQSPQP